VIASKFVDLFARNSGLRDKLVAERDVVLTYALQALQDAGLLGRLAFKGGTCLRKMVFGSAGRFSEDLDFTLDADGPEDDILVRIVETYNREHRGIVYTLDQYYKSDDGLSFGGDVHYRHEWNSAGRFRLQVSLRERPTLPVVPCPPLPQSYFAQLEFAPSPVPCLQLAEMIAEKVRAAYQRVKIRDLYDLWRLAALPFDENVVRSMVVVKLWQVQDPFAPETFFDKIRGGSYDWHDLRRLLRTGETVDADVIVGAIETRFKNLRDLTPLERNLAAAARGGRNRALAGRLRREIRRPFRPEQETTC
jgi:predicted nucleotidyltransferase component of viral defense system